MYFFKDRFKSSYNPNATIGLDIGSRMIKWVCLDQSHALKYYGIQAIPFPVTGSRRDVKIAALLKETLVEREFIKNCILNIPDSLSFSQWVEIDYPGDQNINEVIELLVEKSIFCPLNKIYFDYQVFYLSPKNKKTCNIFIVVCRKEDLDFRLNIIHEADLIPTVVEINSHALERAYLFFYPDFNKGNNILLEIGSSQLTLLFFNNAKTVVYCENLLNITNEKSILLQIKRGIKRYALSHPCCVLNEIHLICSNKLLINYLLSQLNGFLELKARKLKKGHAMNSELNKNFSSLFLSYGLALRAYLNQSEQDR